MKARESCADKLLERRNADIALSGKQDEPNVKSKAKRRREP